MADKNLSELEWRKFAKGRNLKDAAFVKAIASLERAKTPDLQLEALADIEKQADVLRKADKSNKELASYMGDLDKAVDKQRKLSEFEAKKAKAAQAEAEEDEESPAAITKGMVPLLRQIPKGGEFPVMLASTGKDVAVLVSRRPISVGKRKMLAEFLGVTGGVKYFDGHCVFEEKSYTFVMKTQAAGLAKKVKAGLLAQTELRLKVRVRGEDPNDLDDDGEEAGAEGEEGSATGVATAAAPVPDAPTAPPAPSTQAEEPAAPTTPADPLKAQFDERLATLEPRVLATLKAQSGDVSKIRAVAEFVRGKGEEGNFKAALQGMDSLVKLLDSAAGAPAGATAGAAPAVPAAPAGTIPPAPPLPGTKPAAAGPAAPQDPQMAAFNARLAGLMAKLKDAAAAQAPMVPDVKLQLSEAGMSARKKDFTLANQILDAAEANLASFQPDQGDWDRRLAAIEPDYLSVLKDNPPEATKIRAVMAFAQEAAEGKQFPKAISALVQLEKLLAASKPADATTNAATAAEGAPDAPSVNPQNGYKGIVAYRKTLLDLRAAVAKVEGQIANLVKAIPQSVPDEAELAEELAEELRSTNEDLQDLVDEAMNSAESQDTPITRALAGRLDELIGEVGRNEMIKHVDKNPFGVSMNVADTLTKALSAVRSASPIPA